MSQWVIRLENKPTVFHNKYEALEFYMKNIRYPLEEGRLTLFRCSNDNCREFAHHHVVHLWRMAQRNDIVSEKHSRTRDDDDGADQRPTNRTKLTHRSSRKRRSRGNDDDGGKLARKR